MKLRSWPIQRAWINPTRWYVSNRFWHNDDSACLSSCRGQPDSHGRASLCKGRQAVSHWHQLFLEMVELSCRTGAEKYLEGVPAKVGTPLFPQCSNFHSVPQLSEAKVKSVKKLRKTSETVWFRRFWYGAGYGNRTRLLGLGSRCTTDVLTLHSDNRVIITDFSGKSKSKICWFTIGQPLLLVCREQAPISLLPAS